MSYYMIGGTGGSAPSPQQRKPRGVEAEICRRLGLPYYGFLLYHTANARLQAFLANNLATLDQISGAQFGIFTLVEKTTSSLKIDEVLAKRPSDEVLKQLIQEWKTSTIPFTPDKCFEIAEALQISKADIPCLILFCSRGNGYRSFALLKVRDSWFPENATDNKSLERTIAWLTEIFDALTQSMKRAKRKDAIAEFQKKMDALARKQNIYQPFVESMTGALVPIAKLPLNLVSSLSSILEKIAVGFIQQKLGLK